MQETQETWVRSLGQEDLLEEEMATHSSIFACKIPWTEELSGLQSMGLQRAVRDWAHTSACACTHTHTHTHNRNSICQDLNAGCCKTLPSSPSQSSCPWSSPADFHTIPMGWDPSGPPQRQLTMLGKQDVYQSPHFAPWRNRRIREVLLPS